MKLQILVSAVKKDPKSLAEKMNLQADSIIINQTDKHDYESFEYKGHQIRCYSFIEKGVGLSRNSALMRADGDILLFADEDIVYHEGAPEMILNAFQNHPKADMLFFNVKVTEERRTYYNTDVHPVRFYNCGRYPAYSIAIKRDKLHKSRAAFPLLYGGGAKYSNGEDSLFISDCLKAGLKAWAVPEEIGEEIPRPSTWFFGYNEKFFYDRGVLYQDLYGKMAPLMALRWLFNNRRVMFEQISMKEAWKLMRKGMKEG